MPDPVDVQLSRRPCASIAADCCLLSGLERLGSTGPCPAFTLRPLARRGTANALGRAPRPAQLPADLPARRRAGTALHGRASSDVLVRQRRIHLVQLNPHLSCAIDPPVDPHTRAGGDACVHRAVPATRCGANELVTGGAERMGRCLWQRTASERRSTRPRRSARCCQRC